MAKNKATVLALSLALTAMPASCLGMPEVERARPASEKVGNNYYELSANLDLVVDKATGQIYADLPYSYGMRVRSEGRVFELNKLSSSSYHKERKPDGTQRHTISGKLEGSQIEVKHTVLVPPDEPYFEERITLRNAGRKGYQVDELRFGFRKKLDDAKLSDFHLVAIPYKKQVDRKHHDYSIREVLENKFSNSDWRNDDTVLGQDIVDSYMPHRTSATLARSEGWALTNERHGLLIIKYNNQMIEYSMIARDTYDDLPCMRYGGVAFSLCREPRPAEHLPPGKEITLGLTRYTFYKGGWKQGCYKFREFMDSKGHGLPPDYNPPVNWNELFDIGWYHSDREKLFKHYTLEALYNEAKKAKELGCELLYLDPGWEICEGTTLWDEERLGKVEDLVKTLKERYGLSLGYRTIGRVYRDEFPNDWYIQRTREKRAYARPTRGNGEPINFWEVCTQNEAWKAEKLKRILAITGKGIKFMMFDEFDWRGPCYSDAHGHPVPSTPEGHARAVYWLIEEVKKRHPDVLVEAHDPVWPWFVRYLPTYYRQNISYDENWGFEFMWNPIKDLIDGQALCLYYYNLAYNIPLYLHITMEGDNDNALAFWWYASTVRHLGIGGKKGLSSDRENEVRFQAYKEAMAEYMRLKEFYARGEFYGIDELTHVHTLSDKGAVLNAFNLTNKSVRREIELDLSEIGLKPDAQLSVEGAAWKTNGSKLMVSLNIPAMGSALVKIFLKAAG